MNIIVTNQGQRTANEYLSGSFNSDQLVYEVIRVIDGIALFLEDHFNRLQNSMSIAGLEFDFDLLLFEQKINELIQVNQRMEGNVRFVYSVSENKNRWAFNFIAHSYPTSEQYRQGVAVDLLTAVRQNPNAKVIQNKIRDKANQLIAANKLYEVLLVDHDGKITEGSRSNVFFVKLDIFYTAPENMILVGITRQKVLDCLNELGYQIIEQSVFADEIGSFDAAFLTGTSPKVLPIHQIGKYHFSGNHPEVKNLIDRYDKLIEEYIGEKRNS